ncbi:hypothetical protein LJ737_05285 [Hymenobacter sp. 15J16-1T3B]|uniref:hypothetical protein n=1 Tax=Hymenobacter sp. 15J16-1T3B TaxID=2886941 RepID=UPI001D1093B8|nr:hypothetical protein [Hymenobacter sp. 15J16-1T3B]MCC3156640.1 hypothetical protein [Hymenobacter sp. 15J16-1T3B]
MIKTVLNAAALLIGLTGIFFKGSHWAGADILILTGFGLLLVSIVAFTVGANAEAGVPGPLNYLMVGALAVGVISALFRMMHWQGGAMLGLVMVGLMVVLCVMLLAAKGSVGASRQFLTVTFLFFTLVFAFLALPMRQADAAAAQAATPQANVAATH